MGAAGSLGAVLCNMCGNSLRNRLPCDVLGRTTYGVMVLALAQREEKRVNWEL